MEAALSQRMHPASCSLRQDVHLHVLCRVHNSNVVQAALNATKAKAAELANQTAIESSALVTINVYFHVISSGPDLADGNVPDQWIVAQINTMNKAYVATGFQVVLRARLRPHMRATIVYPYEDVQSLDSDIAYSCAADRCQ